jgi:hypothetical protein
MAGTAMSEPRRNELVDEQSETHISATAADDRKLLNGIPPIVDTQEVTDDQLATGPDFSRQRQTQLVEQ